MQIVANKFAAKASVAFVAFAMALSLFAPAAQAATDTEMQAQIDQLLATIASLQGQVGGTSTTGSAKCTFSGPLTMGSQGAEVTCLQNALIKGGFAIPAGATGYFGTQTQSAVAAWQAANGVMPAAGYFGPISQAKFAAVMGGGSDDDDDDDDSTSGNLEGGEASLEDFTGSDGDDSTLEEGQEEAPVADFEFDVEDGDVEVNRIDVALDGSTNTTTGDTDPWDVFDEISIWVDGDKIADMDASDEDEWSDDEPFSGANTLRFTGLDWVVKEGETAAFTVAFTVAGSVDGAGTDSDWNVFIPFDGIRAEDSQGIQNYTGEDDDDTAIAGVEEGVSFDIDEEGGDDELIIGSSSDDPDSTTFAVDESDKSDWTTVFAFDLDTDDSTNDVEVETMVLDVHVPGDTYNSVVSDARLMIGDEEYDDVTVARGTTATGTLTFDIDKQLVIDAGEEVVVELQLEFLGQSGNYSQGQQVEALATTTSAWEAEGADDITVEGSASGDLHTLRTEGVTIEFVSSTETLVTNDDASTTDNEGQFVLKFDVTAFESDVYVNKTAASGTTATTSGAMFQIEDSNGNAVLLGSNSAVLTSTADTVGSEFKVEEGETETFTLTVTYDPASSTTGFFQLQLYGINSEFVAGASMETQQRALPAADFESDPIDL